MKKTLISILILTFIVSACSSGPKKATKTSCGDPFLDKSKTFTVVMDTNKGSMTIQLDPKHYPISSAHFAALVKSGFYDGLTFHRVVKDFVIQGGDPKADGTGSAKCSVISEAPRRNYRKGDVAWAKAGNDPAGTAGSQFFIITGGAFSEGLKFLNIKTTDVDGKDKLLYGYLGHVTKGMSVALLIESLAPEGENNDGRPRETVTIKKATLKS